MEQRAPGHTVLDDKIYRKGSWTSWRTSAGPGEPGLPERPGGLRQARRTEGDAGLRRRAHPLRPAPRGEGGRTGGPGARPSAAAGTPAHRRGLPPRPRAPAADFWEAIQYYWFVHLGVTTELNTWDSFSPGRLDQHLYPFYRRGLEEGTLTREQAEELLQCLWIKFNNQPAPPKVGVTAAESRHLHRLRPDQPGRHAGGRASDGVNELTYLILDVVEEMRSCSPARPSRSARRARTRSSNGPPASSAPASASPPSSTPTWSSRNSCARASPSPTLRNGAPAAAWRRALSAKKVTSSRAT